MAADIGLYLFPDIVWGPRRCDFDHPERIDYLYAWTREHARRLAGHPSILMSSIGNEIPPLVIRWYGAKRIENFLQTLNSIVKEEAPGTLTTYVSHPPTEYLRLPFLDVLSYNVYLEREQEMRAYLALRNLMEGRTTDDGTSNWELWKLSTTTNNTTPPPVTIQFQSIDLASGAVQLTWKTGGGTTNIVQAATDIAGPFTDISDPILIPGFGETTAQFTDPSPATANLRFYRIRQP